MKTRKVPKPTHLQAAWLRRIAQSSMMKTYGGEIYKTTFYLSSTGEKIPDAIADALIRNGWVKGQKDGMFDDPQSYVALKPEMAV